MKLRLERSLPWAGKGRSGLIAHFQKRGFQVGKLTCRNCDTNTTILKSPKLDHTTLPCPACQSHHTRFTPFRPAWPDSPRNK